MLNEVLSSSISPIVSYESVTINTSCKWLRAAIVDIFPISKYFLGNIVVAVFTRLVKCKPLFRQAMAAVTLANAESPFTTWPEPCQG